MKKCDHCQAELEDQFTVCPNCGQALDQKKNTVSSWKIALIVGVIVLLSGLLIGMIAVGNLSQTQKGESEATVMEAIEGAVTEETVTEETVPATIPADGNPEDATCKGTYLVSDEEVVAAHDVVVATMEDAQLTNGMLQVYYWMEVRGFLSNYGSYAGYFGMDYTQPLDTQPCPMVEGWTWHQYFLDSAILSWQNYQAMALEAEKQGVPMDEARTQELAGLEEQMTASATQNGYENLEALIRSNMGAGATFADYRDFMEVYFRGYSYYADIASKITPTEAEVEAFFDAHAAEYAEQGLTKDTCTVDVRHILVFPEGADSSTADMSALPEEAWTAGEAEAQKLLDAWLAGDKTEESFAQLAGEHSQDPGSVGNGGLYTGVTEGQMVQAFNDWCFDTTRQPGDYGIVRTEYGFHVMYFVGSQTLWQSQAANDLMAEQVGAAVDGVVTQYTMDADYSKMVLGNVDLTA